MMHTVANGCSKETKQSYLHMSYYSNLEYYNVADREIAFLAISNIVVVPSQSLCGESNQRYMYAGGFHSIACSGSSQNSLFIDDIYGETCLFSFVPCCNFMVNNSVLYISTLHL